MIFDTALFLFEEVSEEVTKRSLLVVKKVDKVRSTKQCFLCTFDNSFVGNLHDCGVKKIGEEFCSFHFIHFELVVQSCKNNASLLMFSKVFQKYFKNLQKRKNLIKSSKKFKSLKPLLIAVCAVKK